MRIRITGGADGIGAHLIDGILPRPEEEVLVTGDALLHAGLPDPVRPAHDDPRHRPGRVDLRDDAEATADAPHSPCLVSRASTNFRLGSQPSIHGFPGGIAQGSINLGLRQNPRKLIPALIGRVMKRQTVPVHHARVPCGRWATSSRLQRARGTGPAAGQAGPEGQRPVAVECSTRQAVERVGDWIHGLAERSDGALRRLIHFVKDHPGLDRRDVIGAPRHRTGLGRRPHTLAEEMKAIVHGYLATPTWPAGLRSARTAPP